MIAALPGGAARAPHSGPPEARYVDAARAADPGCDLKPGLAAAGVAHLAAAGVDLLRCTR